MSLAVLLPIVTYLLALVEIGAEYRWHDRRTRANRLVRIVLLLLLTASASGSVYLAYQQERVTAYPKTLTLSAGPWRADSSFKIVNGSEDVRFAVWVKLVLESNDLEWTDIEVEPLSPISPPSQSPQVKLSDEYFGTFGRDTKGRRAFLIRIHSIDPKGVVTFAVRNKKDVADPKAPPSTIAIKVLSYKDEAPQRINRGEESGVLFQLDEEFTAEGVWLLRE